MECSGVTCASLDRERDFVGIEVYILQRQARFLDATALMNRDLERELHPFRFFELFQLGTDQVDLFRVNSGFSRDLSAFRPKRAAAFWFAHPRRIAS
jgi:hypothetical protein